MTASEGAQMKKVVREALREVLALSVGRLAYSFAEAGQLLGRSPRTVHRMIARGQLHPVEVNGAKMISARELTAITTPKERTRSRSRPERSSGNPKKAAAAIDAMLRRRR